MGARLLSKWIASIGLKPSLFGTHSLRRTPIYHEPRCGRGFQLSSATTKVESAVRYFGIEVDDALASAEQIDI
jgi:hypothetical protein